MALPAKGPPLQDMPPKVGYPEVAVDRAATRRRVPGWALWAGGLGVVAFYFYEFGQQNRKRNAMSQEKREARLCILPFLEAEADAQAVYRKRAALRAEQDIMGHYPNWQVGLSVYKSGIYVPPAINKGFPEELLQD